MLNFFRTPLVIIISHTLTLWLPAKDFAWGCEIPSFRVFPTLLVSQCRRWTSRSRLRCCLSNVQVLVSEQVRSTKIHFSHPKAVLIKSCFMDGESVTNKDLYMILLVREQTIFKSFPFLTRTPTPKFFRDVAGVHIYYRLLISCKRVPAPLQNCPNRGCLLIRILLGSQFCEAITMPGCGACGRSV